MARDIESVGGVKIDTMKIDQIRYSLEQAKGQRQAQLALKRKHETEIEETEKRILFTEQAQNIIQTVARQTQAELSYHISELVSLAMSAVFDKPYELHIDFVLRRGKTEADIFFMDKKSGELFDPMQATGGGVVDVASFALRLVAWSLSRPKTDNVLILDEPFRFLSRDLHPKASRMLLEVSGKLGLQIIMVSHSLELIEAANKVFYVQKKRGVSVVDEIEE